MATKPTSLAGSSLDDYLQAFSHGSAESAISNNLFGINHRQQATPVPLNRDNHGFTFFVRPQLNMSTDNLRNHRLFIPLLTNNDLSIQRAVRCLLDPRLMDPSNSLFQPTLKCPLVDNQQAFFPILTNHLKTMSGWPDVKVPTVPMKAGAYEESHLMVDGPSVDYSNFSLSASFRNSRGSPIMLLFYIWVHYEALVYEGILVPYLDMIVENEIDYNTRAYRLVMDSSKKKVQSIAATGASFPVSLPFGQLFDYAIDKPLNDSNNDISIEFQNMGACYNDDILIFEFNKTVAVFNPSMHARNFTAINDNDFTNTFMRKIPDSLLQVFNNRGYARINPNTYDLEWWVSNEMYKSKESLYNNFMMQNKLK